MDALLWDRRTQYIATAVSLGFALAILLAFKTYLVPLAFAATGLYVAWNSNKKVTHKEWRLLYTVLAAGILFLAGPYLKQTFPYNYNVVTFLMVGLIATPWVPKVWARIEAMCGVEESPAAPMRKGRRGKGFSAATSALIAFMLLMMVAPTANADGEIPCEDYAKRDPSLPDIHQGLCGFGQSRSEVFVPIETMPICKDMARFFNIVNPEVKMTTPKVKATPDGSSGLTLDVEFKHSFTKGACNTKYDVPSQCRSVRGAKPAFCFQPSFAKCDSSKTRCPTSPMAGQAAVPTSYMVTVTMKKLGKQVTVYQEVFDEGLAINNPTCTGLCPAVVYLQKETTFSESIPVDFKNLPPSTVAYNAIVTATVTYLASEPSTNPVRPCALIYPPPPGCGGTPYVEKSYSASKAVSVRIPSLKDWVKPSDCNSKWTDPRTGIEYSTMMACIKPGAWNKVVNSKDVAALWLGKATDDKIPGVNPGKLLGGWNKAPNVKEVQKVAARGT